MSNPNVSLVTAVPSDDVEVITCDEQGPVEIPLGSIMNADGQLTIDEQIIKGGDYFTVSLSKGKLRLLARGYVGYIPLNEHLVVYVRPRVPVGNLGRLATLAGEPARALQAIRAYRTEQGWNDSLTDLYAAALLEHIAAIQDSGMLRHYQRREEVTSTPRGRIMLATSLRRQWARGLRHKVTTSWFERSTDTPANRCLKYAVWLLAQQYQRDHQPSRDRRKLLQRLNGVYPLFDAVQLDHSRRFLTDPTVSGGHEVPAARAAYRPALDLAVSLIEQRAVLLVRDGGPVRLPAVVLDMNSLFENLVRRSLQTAAAERGWPAAVLDGNGEGQKYLFANRTDSRATPDVVVRAPDRQVPLIIEVKNSPVSNAGLTARDGMNQAATYGLSYGTTEVLLVHPLGQGQAGGWHELGWIGEVHLSQYRLDLADPDITGELGRFADAVERLAGLNSPQA